MGTLKNYTRLELSREQKVSVMISLEMAFVSVGNASTQRSSENQPCRNLLASAGQSIIDPAVHWRDIHGQHSRFPLGGRIVGHIATTGKPVIVEQINNDSKWIVHLDWAEKEEIQGFAGQPLIFQGKVLGVLAIFTKIPLNTSIPRDLFESEFFGHAKGSFSGSITGRDGRFYAADGGTLFLDEVGEIPLEHQGKLLRVLQEGEYARVGEDHTRSTDVRIIAATNKDLKEEVRAGRFREDLYFRLNVFPIKVAPLRERKEDIEPLAIHFLQLALRKMNRPKQRLTTHHLQQLQHYDWPGNVRELLNIIERTAIFADSGPLQIQLPESMSTTRVVGGLAENYQGFSSSENQTVLTEKEIVALQKANTKTALKQCNWKIYGSDGAAALLGIKPTTLATRIVKINLKKDRN